MKGGLSCCAKEHLHKCVSVCVCECIHTYVHIHIIQTRTCTYRNTFTQIHIYLTYIHVYKDYLLIHSFLSLFCHPQWGKRGLDFGSQQHGRRLESEPGRSTERILKQKIHMIYGYSCYKSPDPMQTFCKVYLVPTGLGSMEVVFIEKMCESPRSWVEITR